VDRTRSEESEARTLLREFGLGATISLAFAFISPIVALYGVFATGIVAAGGIFWWGAPITLAGQLLVALALGQLGSIWPIEGSIYQWSRNLLGRRYGWFAGWIYIWSLIFAMAAVAYGGGQFVAQIFDLDTSSPVLSIALSILLLALASWGNTMGRGLIKLTVGFCIGAEIVGSLGIGVYLLLFHHHNDFGVLLTEVPAVRAGFFNSPMALAVAYAGWSFLGFETAGSIAEEVRDAPRAVPRAMVMSLILVALLVMLASLGLTLAIPDMDQVLAGKIADPVVDTLSRYLPPLAVKAVLVTFVTAFFASLLSIQAAASRVIWAFARERELPASGLLARLSATDRIPVNAILATSVPAVILFFMSATNLYQWLISFTSAGFYIAFCFPVLGATIIRLRGAWRPGPVEPFPVSGPPVGALVTFAAMAWLVFETINIVWPRGAGPDSKWYDDWVIAIIFAALGLLGYLIRLGLGLEAFGVRTARRF
jgi:amino acid transporter